MALANIEKTNWKTNANLKSSFSIFKLILTKILSVLKPFFSSGRFGDPNKTKNASMIRLSGRYSHINLKERKKNRNNKTITENHLNFYSVNSMFCVLQFPNLVVRKWEYEGKKWSALILDMAFLHQSLLLNITFIILFFLRIEIRCVCAREIKKKEEMLDDEKTNAKLIYSPVCLMMLLLETDSMIYRKNKTETQTSVKATPPYSSETLYCEIVKFNI